MTDRHSGYVVTLERDLREDDAEATLAAIRQIRGVLLVEPVVAAFADQITAGRARREVVDRVLAALEGPLPAPPGGRR